MDIGTELGEGGFRWIFLVYMDGGGGGALNSHIAVEQACDYFHDTYGGHMVNLAKVMVPRDQETRKQEKEKRQAIMEELLPGTDPAKEQQFCPHCCGSEHSRSLFLHPHLVKPEYKNASPVLLDGQPLRNWDDAIRVAQQDDWPGCFGSFRLGSAAEGAVRFKNQSRALADLALKILDGLDYRQFPRYSEYHRGEGPLQHNGLWLLEASRFKDVTLVGRMNIHTEGPNPHDLLLHLCGGDMPTSPDHWVEVSMKDIGDGKARFSVFAAVEKGAFSERNKEVVLDRPDDNGFMARLSLNGSTNLCSTEVQDAGGRWHEIVKPVALNLRTTHCEVKMRGGAARRQGEPTTSVGWFEGVRIYPRATAHPILVRLVMRDGTPIFTREGSSWPPKVRIGDEEPRGLDDLVVELCSADRKSRIASVQSANFAHYMLPLDHEGWDVFPVGAVIRVSCDGRTLGEAEILLNGLEGLYPDDVYDVFME